MLLSVRAFRQPAAVVGAILSGVVLSGCWWQAGWEPGHSNFNPLETTLGASNVGSLQYSWLDEDGVASGAIAVSGGAVYLACKNSGGEPTPTGPPDLRALNTTTGSLIWRTTLAGVPTSPAVGNGIWGGNGLVFTTIPGAGDAPARLIALNAADGTAAWALNLPGHVPSSATLGNAIPPAGGSGEGALFVTLTDTHKVVSVSVGGSVIATSSAALYDTATSEGNGLVYVGQSDGSVAALNASTLAPVWSTLVTAPPNASVVGAPAVSGTRVFANTANGGVAAFDAASGARLWTDSLVSDTALDSPAVANGVAYVTEYNGSQTLALALNAATGSVDWTFTPDAMWKGSGSGPIVANGVLWYDNGVSTDAVNIASGAEAGMITNGLGAQQLPPTVSDGQLFIPSASSGALHL